MQNAENKELDRFLLSLVAEVLVRMEKQDKLVCVADQQVLAQELVQELQSSAKHLTVSSKELSGLRSLIYHAVNDEKFFDWEMPTLTGYTAEQFKEIAEKLPKI